jgi:hypothetical protein
MVQLKRWESPRREGRNDKGKGGNAKKKQWQKRLKMLKNKLKSNQEGGVKSSPFLFAIFSMNISQTRTIKIKH